MTATAQHQAAPNNAPQPGANTANAPRTWDEIRDRYDTLCDQHADQHIERIRTEQLPTERNNDTALLQTVNDKLSDPNLSQAEQDHYVQERDRIEARIGSSEDEYLLKLAEGYVELAREPLAKGIVERTRNTWRKTGREINAGISEGLSVKLFGWSSQLRGPKLNEEKLTTENAKFSYDVTLAAALKLRARVVEADGTIADADKEKAKKAAALDLLLGTEGDADANKKGVLFQLNDAVLEQHRKQGGQYELSDTGEIVRDANGSPVERSGKARKAWLATQKFFGRKWNEWSDGSIKGRVYKAAVTMSGGVAVGAIIGSGIGSVGLAVGAATAGAATRLTKSLSISQVEKSAATTRAEKEAAEKQAELEQMRAEEFANIDTATAYTSEDANDLTYDQFVTGANTRSRQNKIRFGLGIVAGPLATELGSHLHAFMPWAGDGLGSSNTTEGKSGSTSGSSSEAPKGSSTTTEPTTVPTPEAQPSPAETDASAGVDGGSSSSNPAEGSAGASAKPDSGSSMGPEKPESDASADGAGTGGANADPGSDANKSTEPGENPEDKPPVQPEDKQQIVHEKEMNGKTVWDVFTNELGTEEGNEEMRRAANRAIKAGALKPPFYPDPSNPNLYWYMTADGSSETDDVVEVLAKYSDKIRVPGGR